MILLDTAARDLLKSIDGPDLAGHADPALRSEAAEGHAERISI